MPDRHIVAIGGWDADEDGALGDFVLGLARSERPRMCYIPTAGAERDQAIATFFETFSSRTEPSVLRLFGVPRAGIHDFLLGHDVVWVSGGNTANMLAIWRLHGLDSALREAWESGVVLAGWSAGGICWFEGGVTDSFGPDLAPLNDGLRLLAAASARITTARKRGRRPTPSSSRKGSAPDMRWTTGSHCISSEPSWPRPSAHGPAGGRFVSSTQGTPFPRRR